MSKYIDAEKLIERLEEMKRAEYENCGGVNSKTGALQEVQELIASLQQEPRFPQYDNIVDKVFGAGNLEGFEYHEAEMLVALAKEELLKSLQQEQPKKNKNCSVCPHCVDRKDQNGWHFKGCFGGPYKGKFIAEIEECPLQKEPLLRVDLEKEIDDWYNTMGIPVTANALKETARHFYELARQKYEK